MLKLTPTFIIIHNMIPFLNSKWPRFKDTSSFGRTYRELAQTTINISAIQPSISNVMLRLGMWPEVSFPLGSVWTERAYEARLLAALVLLVVGQSWLVLVHTTTIETLEHWSAICVQRYSWPVLYKQHGF